MGPACHAMASSSWPWQPSLQIDLLGRPPSVTFQAIGAPSVSSSDGSVVTAINPVDLVGRHSGSSSGLTGGILARAATVVASPAALSSPSTPWQPPFQIDFLGRPPLAIKEIGTSSGTSSVESVLTATTAIALVGR